MADYVITLKVRCRKRTVSQDIERIVSTGRFQESFEMSISSYLEERLRRAYLDVSDVDISARFSKKRAAKGVAGKLSDKKTVKPPDPVRVKQ